MKRAVILDVSSILYRSYFKLINMRTSNNVPTGALYGLVNSILRIIDEFKPDLFLGALDSKRTSLKRRELYEEYKLHRKPAPQELAVQMQKVEPLLKELGLSVIKIDGEEADDIIASSVEHLKDDYEVLVFTGDKDLMQLIPRCKIVRSDFSIISEESEVKELLGVLPSQITDLFALQGDASDGIPGVKGVGPKTASKLINEYETIENLLDHVDDLKEGLKAKLEESKDILKISKELATLNYFPIENIEEYKGFKDSLPSFLEELEFRSILKKIGVKKDSVEIKIEKVDTITLNRRSTVIFEDNMYYAYDGEILKISDKIDLNNQVVDTFNAKKLYKKFDLQLGIDVEVAYHLIFSEDRATDKRVIKRVLGEDLESIEQKTVAIHKVVEYATKELESRDLMSYYEEIEKPMISVLAKMEKTGIAIDVDSLHKFEIEVKVRLETLTKEIYTLAEEEFNLNSPKQLSHILFEKLGMPVIKKNKTGYSTSVEVLEQLQGYKIVSYILEYRKLTKLLSTYILPLQKDVIHTTYHQNGTVTGRLSSSSPNLQNIPSRTDEGLRVRAAFIPRRKKLLVLDYSQIELRILAYMSKDKALLDAYKKGEDLHTVTAKNIFNKDEITREERHIAKIVNFSLIYGKSSFGLAKELNISMKDASSYIGRYFEKYEGVKKFIVKVEEDLMVNGYVETIFGRRRYFPEINSGKKMLRDAAKRAAVNSVIQGTQAEIIKKAMIDIDKYIEDKDIDLLLQVHDELVLDIKDEKEVDKILSLMKNAVKLEGIDLDVNGKIVDNWSEAK